MVMVGGGATMLSRSGIPASEALLWSAVGALSAVLIGMSPILVNRHGPEAAMVAHVENAAKEFLRAQEDQLAKHHQAQTALASAWQALTDAKIVSGGRIISRSQADLVKRTLAAQHSIVLRNQQLDLHLDSDALVDSPTDIDPARTVIPHSQPTVAYRIYRALMRDSHSMVTSQKVVLATLLTSVVSLAIGFDRPDWGAVSAFLLLQWGPGRIAGTVRSVHRMVGSFAGVALFAIFHVLQLEGWSLLVALAVCQFCAEIFVAKNYALCVVFSTPLALLMGGAVSHSLGQTIGARVAEIALSVAISLAILGLWSGRPALRNHVAIQHKCMESMVTVVGLLALVPPKEILAQRRDLQYELLSERRSIQAIAMDQRQAAEEFWDRHLRIQHAGYAILDFCVLHADSRATEDERNELIALMRQAQGE